MVQDDYDFYYEIVTTLATCNQLTFVFKFIFIIFFTLSKKKILILRGRQLSEAILSQISEKMLNKISCSTRYPIAPVN